MNDHQNSRAIVRLLGAAVALLSLLVLFLVVGGVWAFLQYRQLSAEMQEAGGAGALKRSVREVTELTSELSARQEALSVALGARADSTQQRIAVLEKRRDELGGVQQGLIDKTEQMIQIQQLLADEMLALLVHFASTQESLGGALRPGEAAVGGSGNGEGAPE